MTKEFEQWQQFDNLMRQYEALGLGVFVSCMVLFLISIFPKRSKRPDSPTGSGN